MKYRNVGASGLKVSEIGLGSGLLLAAMLTGNDPSKLFAMHMNKELTFLIQPMCTKKGKQNE